MTDKSVYDPLADAGKAINGAADPDVVKLISKDCKP